MNDLHKSPQSSYIVGFIICSLIASCSPSVFVESTSSRRPYDYESSPLHPEITTYLHSDIISVYINLDRDELLYTRDGENTPFTTKILVQLNGDSWIWSDTLTNETPRWLYNRFDLTSSKSAESQKSSEWLDYAITDKNRNSSIKDAIEIRDVLVWNMLENWPISSSQAAVGTPIKIISEDLSMWHVSHVVPVNSLPAPPFSRYKNPIDTLTAFHHSVIDDSWIILNGVQRFTLDPSIGEFILTSSHLQLPEICKTIYSNYIEV